MKKILFLLLAVFTLSCNQTDQKKSEEASSHENFKNEIVKAKEGDTMLTLKDVTPVRLIKNDFFSKIDHESLILILN